MVAGGVAASGDPNAALPSRRALRDPAIEASEAAESALHAQAAQQQAQAAQAAAEQARAAQQEQAQAQAAQQAQAQAAQQAQAAEQAQAAFAPQAAPVQQSAQPVVPAQPQSSPPVPTLPVAQTSFLEQQGYAPVGTTPDTNAWNQPVQPPSAPQAPQAPQTPQTAQTAQTPQTPQVPELVQPQPVQPSQPNAWNQPPQEAPTAAAIPPAPLQTNSWSQPLQTTQPTWGAPTDPSDELDSLFGGSSPAPANNPDAQPGQWGLSPSSSSSPSTSESGSRRKPEAESEVRGSSTFWGWLIAISPILAAGSVIYVLLSTNSALTDWPFEAAVAAPYLLVLLFAFADRTVLRQLGHSQPRSPAWALLSAPVYLIARAGETRAEDGSGTALTLVWFVSVLIAIGGIVGYGFLTGHALIAGLPT